MDQYQLANAAEKIDGYFSPSPSDITRPQGKAFERAQAECITHLQAQLDAVKGLTVEQFMAATKRSKLYASEVAAAEGVPA